MSNASLPVFDSTLQKADMWLKDLMERMGWDDRQRAYLALRGVLQSLRDRLPVQVAAKLGAQLPILIRGIYYEGWVPSRTPLKIHSVQDFIDFVCDYFGHDALAAQAERIVRNTFRVMARHVADKEMDQISKVLPASIASLLAA